MFRDAVNRLEVAAAGFAALYWCLLAMAVVVMVAGAAGGELAMAVAGGGVIVAISPLYFLGSAYRAQADWCREQSAVLRTILKTIHATDQSEHVMVRLDDLQRRVTAASRKETFQCPFDRRNK